MKKRLHLLLALIIAAASTWATTLYVPGGYATIQAAINAATDGDTIQIDAGTYIEALSVGKSLTFIGSGPASSPTTIITSTAGNIINLTVTGKSFTFQNLIVHGNVINNGIKAGGSININSLTLKDLIGRNCQVALYLAEYWPGDDPLTTTVTNLNMDNVTLTNNKFIGAYIGKTVLSGTVTDCTVTDNGYSDDSPDSWQKTGLQFVNFDEASVPHVVVTNSTFSNNGAGASNIERTGLIIYTAYNAFSASEIMTVSGCSFTNHPLYAVRIKNGYNAGNTATVDGTFTGNYLDIWFNNIIGTTSSTTLVRNTFTGIKTVGPGPTYDYSTIKAAVDAASPNDIIQIAAGTYTEPSLINVNKDNLSIQGAGSGLTFVQVSGIGDRFDISANGVTIKNLSIEKTDKTGEQNIIRIRANDFTLQNTEIWGQFVIGDGDVSRAMVVNAGAYTGMLIEGNTFHNLRQPMYLSGTNTGIVSDNYTYNTKGWVLEGGNLTFTGNTWGVNVYDMAILSACPSAYYSDIVLMCNANNNAVIEDQRVSPAVLSVVHVDAATSFTTDLGGRYHPYSTIAPAIVRVVAGGTVNVAAGIYAGNITINKSLTILGDPGDALPGPGASAPVIDGGSAPGDAFLIANGVSNVTINGFEMRNFTSPDFNGIGNGISAWEANTSNITIQNNYFHHLGYNGVLVGNDGAAGDHNNWLIKNNIIDNFGYIGFELTNTSNSSIEDNEIHLMTPYIGAIFSSARRSETGLTIKNNQIDGTPSTAYPVIYIYAYDNDMLNPNLNNVLIENNAIETIGTPAQIYIRNINTGTVTGVTVANNNLFSLRTNTPAIINAVNNYWGSANGPVHVKNVFNIGSQGGNITVDAGGSIPVFCPWWKDISGTPGSYTGTSFAPITNNETENYSNYTDAISGTTEGGTVNAAAGTYTEQVLINENNLTLTGAGVTSTYIKSPAVLATSFGTKKAVVCINGVANCAINNLTIDGDGKGDANYQFVGLAFWNAGGTVTNVDVTRVRDNIFSGAQHGVGVYAYNDITGTYSIEIDGMNVTDFQKNAFALSGDGLIVDLDNIQVTGAGPTSVTAQNGIQIGYGASGTVDNSTASGIAYTGASWTASGVLLYEAGDITFNNVDVDGSQTSYYIIDGNADLTGCDITNVAGDGLYALSTSSKSNPKVSPSPVAETYTKSSKATVTVSLDDCIVTGQDVADSWGVAPWIDGGTTNMTISGCTITHWDYGIFAYEGSGGGTLNVTASGNDLSNNNFGFGTNITSKSMLDATNNWWGHATGPYNLISNPLGQGSEVGDNILFDPWFSSPTGDAIDIGLYATSCSDFEVRLRALTNITNTTLTNVQFTIRWPETTPNLSLTDIFTTYSIAQQGATVQSGGYNYALFIGVDVAINNWVAGTEYIVLSFSHNQIASGTGDFVIGNDAWTTANNGMYYAELLGNDKTGFNYENAIGVDLGKCPLYIVGTFTANDKVYDGNTDATFLANSLILDDVKAGDLVTLTGLEIDFDTKDVGTDKLVSITDASLSGADASKYELFLVPTPTTTADITPKTLTADVIGNPTKPYDGNTTATLASSNYSITGLVLSESITITETVGNYASANVGTHLITVSLDVPGDFTAGSGTLLTNYTLPAIATGNGTITAISLTITADNKNKVYDGAVFPYGSYTVSYSGFIPGEGPGNLGGVLVYTGSAITATAVGFYVITPGGSTSSNYTISFFDGQLDITPVTLGLKVMLQGPYNTETSLMKTDLYTAGQIPADQPFNIAPWSYSGSESASPPATAVDWVLVELRSGTGGGTMIGRCAALLNNNGTVSITIDDVTFPEVHSGESYYIVIWHRNHMPVMSATAQTVPVTSYDFTVLANLYGTNPAINLDGSVYGMIAGDVTKNGMLKYSGPNNDRGPIIARIVAETGVNDINGFTVAGYWQEDVNMNSNVMYLGAGNDRGIIATNLSTLTGTPYLNNTYSSVVPGAYTGGKDGSNDGPVDIQFTETAENLSIEIITNEKITNGVVDNIQLTLAWDTGETEIEDLHGTLTSGFILLPQGDIIEMGGINYLTFASITPAYLPQVWNAGESVTVMVFEKTNGQLVGNHLWIADNDFTSSINGEFYISNWGTDVTGMILNTTVGIVDPTAGFVKLYPNPVTAGNLWLQINSANNENLEIEVWDMTGKLKKKVECQTVAGTMTISIDVADFSSGVYLINVMGDYVPYKNRFIVK
jgi:hypothetical protein